MNVDSFFTAGRGHPVCQDYAMAKLHGEGSFPIPDRWYGHRPYLIVSDGCSSSPQTDVGARILVHIAEKFIREMYDRDSMLSWEAFGVVVITQAQLCAKIMGLPYNCLDATLLVGFETTNLYKTYSKDQFGLTIYIYGDGHVLGVPAKEEEESYYMAVEYDQNAPYYLTYLTDTYRRKLYLDQGILRYKNSSNRRQKVVEPPASPNMLHLSYKDYKYIALGSDGLSAFMNSQTGESYPGAEIMNSFLSFKNTKGEFVKRRVKRAIRDLERDKDIIPGDDVSIAVLEKP